MVDTGSDRTFITPLLLGRLGLSLPDDAPREAGYVFGGRKVEAPFMRLSVIQVGNAVVENLEVGVYDFAPQARIIDGLLGGDFLKRFKVTLDNKARQMHLEPLEKTKGVASAALPAAKPIPDIKSIAGKWEGSVQTWRGLERVTVTIEEDGSYSWDTPSGSAIGTMRVNDGKIRFHSSFYGPSGELTLQEREGERLLKITYDHLDWRGALKPAK